VERVASAGQKPQNRPVSNFYTGIPVGNDNNFPEQHIST